MMSPLSVSIITTSYNQEKTLRLLLASLERQTFKDFEVLIADDGSSDGTESLCQIKRCFPVRFITQPDMGYRKSKIVNEAIRNSQGKYLIFLDGDVILEKHFVEDHWNFKEEDHFICGRRVDLGPEITEKISENDVTAGRFDRWNFQLMWSACKGDTQYFKRSLRIQNLILRRILGYHRPLDILGSNFSAWKKDIVLVNGFNEALESYWGEDGDLFIRLRNSGKIGKGAKSICIQYHLFHKRREPTADNVSSYSVLLKNKDYKWAAKGLND